ncbi:MAG: glycosyltransferase [Thermodesulfovibrionales bacterium]|jgi:hypothetical protein
MRTVRIVTATTANEANFKQRSMLAQSLCMFPSLSNLKINIFYDNFGNQRRGLGTIYNLFLRSEYKEEILLFVHDDVFLNDWHIAHRLNDAIQHFDVIGLAGNTNPDFNEPAWNLAWNRVKYPNGLQPVEYKSGSVTHMYKGEIIANYYGESPRECQLLDGLFLALNTKRILEKSVRFDEQFEFNFYDLDFCRQCLSKNIRLGTWPIAVTHASEGDFETPEWISAKEKYLLKWR